MTYLPITLEFTLRPVSDKTPLGNLIREQLLDNLGNSLSGEGIIQIQKKNNELSKPYRVKIDTGAFMSLLPYTAFLELNPSKYIRYTLFGIQRIPECGIECAVLKCKIILLDSKWRPSPEIESWIAFSLGSKVPSLLGMRNILDSYDHRWLPTKKKMEIVFY